MHDDRKRQDGKKSVRHIAAPRHGTVRIQDGERALKGAFRFKHLLYILLIDRHLYVMVVP